MVPDALIVLPSSGKFSNVKCVRRASVGRSLRYLFAKYLFVHDSDSDYN
jgi:hypothetical protein